MITQPITRPQTAWLVRVWHSPAFRTALVVFVMVRIISAAAAVWVVHTAPPSIDWEKQPVYNLHTTVLTAPEPLRTWIEPWYRWDTGWFISIAHNGYHQGDGSIIFPPLYPLGIRVFSLLTGGDYLLAGLLISNLSCLIMLVLFYRLVALDYGDQIAQHTILLYMIFPAAFYLVAAYTEALFTLWVMGAWLAVRHQRYWLAGGLALLASLTRTQGWTLALPFALIAYLPPGGGLPDWRDRRALLRPLPALIGGPLGTALYLFGMQIAGLGSVQDAFAAPPWQTQVVLPWQSLWNTARFVLEGHAQRIDLANVAAFIFAAALGMVAIRRLAAPYWSFIWLTLSFMLMRSHYLIQLHGMLRYVIDLFPIFIVLALLLEGATPRHRAARVAYMVLSFGLQVLMVTLFVEWNWVA